MENEEKIKVCLEKMKNVVRCGIGNVYGGESGFYNPILAGMEIGKVFECVDELIELMGYKIHINIKNRVELTKIK